MSEHFDLAVVGAGIIGLSVALAAVKKGKKVVVIERNAKAIGASIRNFGFITISGQKQGDHWARARRARDVWAEVVQEAGIEVLHRGLVMPAYRQEAEAVLDAFLETDMGSDCRRISAAEALEHVPSIRAEGMRGALYSPHEIRVESREAIPKIAAWLEARHGVTFHWNTAVNAVDGTTVSTSRGVIEAEACVVCPGDDFSTLFPDRIAPYKLRVCTLQMLRVMPAKPIKFDAAVMSDLSFGRYEGFADLPVAKALCDRLDAELSEMRREGIHLIAVRSADGSLVVGDSHVYGNAQEPFAQDRIDTLIMEAFDQIFDLPGREIIGRWCGSYASASDRVVMVDEPADNIRLVMVTGGTGASTGFALGEQVINSLYA
ncbi:TIGR03364 family FAD-dependent oxidoreductase [Rhizobium sp. RM]|uniref:TIGR03364 family FAD-dependent oxidoreductase n=1 Tax=Rhizobium sp. RM TaxID=2748079 RepID=UPI00110F1403|nr:TIGR03364 family FAD-dependent oxidoreductase [Rhizobium sp. RM]NWJ25519.1 TIGR03364 family FAD-dependent oxidoreductase [Rhizobium sp. RM]TMV22165.1 TIGR03364 family FAD-dependent oxidoreductase [Rhizobium sp. Td3]